MGLKYILDTEQIFHVESAGVDAWGISSPSGEKTAYSCCIRGAEDSTPIEAQGGKHVIPSYTVSFNGKVPFTVGETLEVEGTELVILRKKEVKDLSRKVMFTKVTL